jgi:hypothetical protein
MENKKKDLKIVKNQLCIEAPPPDFVGKDPLILSSFNIVPQLAKKIEQAGHPYAALQGKFMRANLRQKIASGQTTDKKGKALKVDDSEEEEEEVKNEN